MKKIIPVVALFILLVSSCETEFDVTADWKDITVVYCLLDQQEETQYIKINKAFLGEENALVMAQNPDSSNYSGNLEVVIEEYTANHTLARVLEFDTTTIYNKEPGTFYAPRQIVYKSKPYNYHEIKIINLPNGNTVIDTIWLDDEHTYKLKIKNTTTGKEITSVCNLTGDFAITYPGINTQSIKFDDNPNDVTNLKWSHFDSIARYELLLQFQYFETYFNSPDTLIKTITLATDIKIPDLSQNEFTFPYKDQFFFNSCSKLIPNADANIEDNVKSRLTDKVVLTISGAATELNSYIEVYEPSESIVQDLPEYTNIVNGIGIFSSRIRNVKKVDLNLTTVSTLQGMNLKFVY